MREAEKQTIILALESGGDASSAAICLPSGRMFHTITQARHGHAERLASQIEQVREQANLPFADITHIAAGCGPGSFTGIRVCLAAATGLILAGGAEPVGIHMLEALLYQASQTDDEVPVIAILDSRRQSVYARMSHAKASFEGADLDLDEASLHRLISDAPNSKLIGVLPEGWAQKLPQNTNYQPFMPSAELVASFAAHKISQKMPLAPLQAAYLAPPKLGPAPRAS